MYKVQALVSVESGRQSHLRCDNMGDEEEMFHGLGDVHAFF